MNETIIIDNLNIIIVRYLNSGETTHQESEELLKRANECYERFSEQYAGTPALLQLKRNIQALKYALGVKVLTPYSHIELERGKALSTALSGPWRLYIEGLRRERVRRYEQMEEELDLEERSIGRGR